MAAARAPAGTARRRHRGLSRPGGDPERLAPVAGGLGAGLESEDAIREAGYSYTPDADEMLAPSPSESSI